MDTVPPVSIVEVFTWLADNMRAVEVMCDRAAEYYGIPYDDCLDYCVDLLTTHGVTWFTRYSNNHASGASKSTYVLACLEYKLRRCKQKIFPFTQLDDHYAAGLLYTSSEEEQSAVTEIVANAVSGLTNFERWLILCRHVYNLSFADVGGALGMSKSTARLHYYCALDKCRSNGTK